MITRAVRARLPLAAGEFQAYGYRDEDGAEHMALVYGDLDRGLPVHVHTECLTGDAFGSLQCNCHSRLQAALRTIADTGSGVVIYLRGRQRHDHRTAAAILADLGVETPHLLPTHCDGLMSHAANS
jgi:GTP cyclohydrolase II